METTNGSMFQKNTSRVFQISNIRDWVFVTILLILGVAAVVLHIRMKTPLHIPGHHGLDFMMLFMAGKAFTRFRYSMTISAFGASAFAMLPILSFGNPFMPLTFLLPGIIADLMLNKNKTKNYFFIALAGGLAYASIPLCRQFIMMATGFPFGSLLLGLFYPFVMHFVFGALGSVIGYALIKKNIKN